MPVTAGIPLKGAVICLKGFTAATNLVSLEPKTKPTEIEGFKYINLTREQDKHWEQEWKSLEKSTNPKDWREIGNVRNGYGMVMSHVYALNDPAVWLLESLKLDLEAQGARVVDASQAANADVIVSGNLQLCRADMYFVINGTLVVDLEVQPKNGTTRHVQLHTHGATAAMMASEGEYFHALRDARQKFSILTAREIAQAFKTKP